MSKIKVTEIAPSSSNTPSITLGTNSNVTFANGVTATSFTGDGANLTSLPAANLTGTIPDARFPATLPAASGANLTSLSSTNLTGTIPDARFPATLPAVSGANLTGISAGALEHVADYSIPTGQSITTWTPLTTGSLQNDTRYYIRGHFGQPSAGGHIRVHPHIYDSSSLTQYEPSVNTIYSLDTATHYYGGYSGNQSSTDWTVYEGGYYQLRFNFELWFTTYLRPHAQSRLFGDDNINMICHGNHRDTTSNDFRRINGLSFSNSWGYQYNDKSRLSLYKYSNY